MPAPRATPHSPRIAPGRVSLFWLWALGFIAGSRFSSQADIAGRYSDWCDACDCRGSWSVDLGICHARNCRKMG